MTNDIEIFDTKRRKFFRLYLVFLILFFVTWMTRFILLEIGALPALLNRILIGVLVAKLVVMSYAVLGLNTVREKARKDPVLREALDNELIRHYRTKSWKFAYFAVMICLAIFAVFDFISPIKDFIAVVLTALWAGIVGYLLAFYRMERR